AQQHARPDVADASRRAVPVTGLFEQHQLWLTRAGQRVDGSDGSRTEVEVVAQLLCHLAVLAELERRSESAPLFSSRARALASPECHGSFNHLDGGPARAAQRLKPNMRICFLPSSVIFCGLHGGLHTNSTLTAVTPSTFITANSASVWMRSWTGQPMLVRVISMSTWPLSSTATS